STLSGNQANGAGGGASLGCVRAFLTATDSTISGNSADEEGGGLNLCGTADLRSVTVVGNSADDTANSFPAGTGGGITGSATALRNSVVANNVDATDSAADCNGGIVSGGHNLIETVTDCSISGDTGSNVTGQDPMLGMLQIDPGSATATHRPLPGSPAIDAGDPGEPGLDETACDASDQRNYLRPVDGDDVPGARCDVGAVEVQRETLLVTLSGSGSGTVTGAGISCPATCDAAIVEGTEVALTATAGPGSTFAGFADACSGMTCEFTKGPDFEGVTATFDSVPAQPGPQQAKTLSLSSSKRKVPEGKKVRLTATMTPCVPTVIEDVIRILRGSKVLLEEVAGSDCAATKKVKIKKKTRFEATSPADDDSAAGTSDRVVVKLKRT
ncbi:MAG: choice-of-anchor Q domain-containing protein, partial [Actinomycetota bacterium]